MVIPIHHKDFHQGSSMKRLTIRDSLVEKGGEKQHFIIYCNFQFLYILTGIPPSPHGGPCEGTQVENGTPVSHTGVSPLPYEGPP